MKKKILFIALLIISIQLFALEVPPLTGRVVDNAGILDSSEIDNITKYLSALESSSGTQLAVLTIDSLQGENLETFTYKTATKWALGNIDENNGVLLLVAISERKVRIEVGYGLEGVLTDAASGYIIRNVITPSFKKGDYGKGILNGVIAMGKLILGQMLPSQYQQIQAKSKRSDGKGSAIALLIFLVILTLMIIFLIKGPKGLFGLMNRGSYYISRRDPKSDYSSGGFYNGGSSNGGGFSGGGGSFGGGGASGGW